MFNFCQNLYLKIIITFFNPVQTTLFKLIVQLLFIFSGPASKLMFKLCLALWCGIIGSFFTFPGLRFAKMHKDALKYCAERTFLKYGFHGLKF